MGEAIVVGVDGSACADRALRWSIREAQLRTAPLTIVHAYDDVGHTPASRASARERAHRLVADVVARHQALLDQANDHQTVVTAAPQGVAATLLGVGRQAQLVVVGARALVGFNELLLGSTGHHVVMHTAVPVALIRTPGPNDVVTAEERDGLRPIVVGVDQSPESQDALRWAIDEACRRDVEVLAVRALDLPDPTTLRVLGLPVELVTARLELARDGARDEIDEQIRRALPMRGDVRINRVVDDAAPATALQRYGTHEHLLVVGTRGRRGFAELAPGSVSHQCAHHAAGPLIVVPHRH